MTGIWYEAFYHIHELGHLVPAEKYFDEHPEYFALIGGKRIKEKTQPCLTNPGLIQLVIERVREWIRRYPQARIVDVSMLDWGNWCQCPTCRASYAKYGRNGTHLWFANKVAEDIEEDYPDILISALTSYANDRPAPLGGIRPRKNVMIKAGYVSACRYHALDDCERNLRHGYARDLRDWCDITPGRVLLWLYPYGTGAQMHGLERTYRLVRDLGVKGIFLCDGVGRGPKYMQLYDLEQYLHAKLMWDPSTDVEKTVREFCEAFYGPAAAEMVEVYHLMNDGASYTMEGISPPKLAEFPGFHCQTSPPPLTLKAMKQLDELFGRAEPKVKTDPVRLKRVHQGRLFLQYNILCDSPQEEEMFAKAVRDFPAAAREAGLTQVINQHTEWKRQDVDEFATAMSQPGKGKKKDVK